MQVWEECVWHVDCQLVSRAWSRVGLKLMLASALFVISAVLQFFLSRDSHRRAHDPKKVDVEMFGANGTSSHDTAKANTYYGPR